MKFKIDQTELLNIIQLSQSVIEKRNTVPVLSNIMLKASGKELHLAVTDLEVFLTATVPCDTTEEGDITVPVKQLHDILRELPSGQKVSFVSKENHWMEIVCGKVDFNLVGLPAKDFPTIPNIENLELQKIDAEMFSEMIDKTIFSISNDETRYHLNGVYFARTETQGQKTLRMVSTDGHRLSLIERGLSTDLKLVPKGVIIPRKGLNEMRKILAEGQGDFYFGVDENRAVVKRGGMLLQIRLIEGEFPPYEKVIPQNNDKVLKVSRDLLLSSLKRVSLMSNDVSKTVTLSIKPGMMEIRSNNLNGEAKEDLEIDYQGEGMKVGFNARYFIDVLNCLDTVDVELDLKDQLSPGIIKNPKDEHYTAVVMPMRI